MTKKDRIRKILLDNGCSIQTKIDNGHKFENCWYSSDDQYMIHDVLINELSFLLKYKITHNVTPFIGYSPSTQSWYGYTHRGIYGFKIGEVITKADVGYAPTDEADFIRVVKSWFSDDDVKIIQTAKGVTIIEGGYENEIPYPTWGKGEHTIKTLADAKAAAISFVKGLS